jgi:hypothetical protein
MCSIVRFNDSNSELVKRLIEPYFLNISIIWYKNSIQKYATFYFGPIVDVLFDILLPVTLLVNYISNKIEKLMGYKKLKTTYFEKKEQSQIGNIKDGVDIITYGQTKNDVVCNFEKTNKISKINLYDSNILQLVNSPEYSLFLSVFSKENRMVDVTDTLGSLFMSNA